MRLAAFALVFAFATAHGQTVYRCGSEYSQKPCADARTLTPEAAPSAAEAKQASEQAKRNAKLANEMEKQRLAEEKKVAGPQMVVTGVKPAASAASQARKAKKKEPDFKAVAPPPKKPKQP
jgi:hypothetical protein